MTMENFGGHNNRGHVDWFSLNFFKTKLNCKTLLDVGCGTGLNCDYAEKVHGYTATGLEADPDCKKAHDRIIIHDYEKNGAVTLNETFDLGWSVSVSEHIDESASDYYVETFTRCRWILFTWCTPGYGGYHHVNEQRLEYWIPKFEKQGMYVDYEKSKTIKNSNQLQMVKHTDWSTALKNKRKEYLSRWATVFKNCSIQ